MLISSPTKCEFQTMIIRPLKKIIRIKGIHLENVYGIMFYSNLVKLLTDKGFILIEKSSDGFFETFENPTYKSNIMNTIANIEFEERIREMEHNIIAIR